ncbi:uracil-DNA glycosylase [Arcticibacter tournemirensis]|uniref:Uracil-DNA glycosylase n=2 Tax=Arcticibacter tournemirensis TaxID=699437 RepID=A0A5M9H6N5_9SPHI|nr:uracil-DNA glycosylase [Arcticibacter tournemirensis]KAA8481825.1 uracil-DNA glycosylase [Arcticibacter tournemirensis]TQM50139.1 uracil-DNA glycosylase [Arcticibacter tournemirensis]
MPVQIEESWKAALEGEFQKDYMKDLKAFLLREKQEGKTVFPPGNMIFNAFNHTPFQKVKAVILGQDPYHGQGQAHGLAFSVQKGVTVPPSLRSIYKELKNDIEGFTIPNHGELTKWADEGVLLLNATLTVRKGEPASHHNKGWEKFTDQAIIELSEKKKGIIFLLWGKNAQAKMPLIDANKHFILKAAHPSPYSAEHGFFGCRHFSKTNQLLKEQGLEPIDWQI